MCPTAPNLTHDLPPLTGTLRLKVSVIDCHPEIWRLIEVDASMRLDEFHDVLQITVGWRESHLHQFLDADPFDHGRRHTSLPSEPRRWLDRESINEGLPGSPEDETSVGEAFALGGPLFYEYDFGDSWTHRIELLEELPADQDRPRALLVRGERRGPAENSGGISGYHDLIDALEDPDHERHDELREWAASSIGPWEEFDPAVFDDSAVDRELAARFPAAGASAVTAADEPPASSDSVTALIERMPPGLRTAFRSHLARSGVDDSGTPTRDVPDDAPDNRGDLADLDDQDNLAGPDPLDDPAAAERFVAPYLWLLRRIGTEGLTLTAAGWLPPAVVYEAMHELGWEWRWIGQMKREERTIPIRVLRENAQRLGLIRKLKGRLLLSTAAKRLLDDPIALSAFLAHAVVHRNRHDAITDATVLLAIEISGGDRGDRHEYLPAIAFGLGALGWVRADGFEFDDADVAELIQDAWDVLTDLGVFEHDRSMRPTGVTEAGQQFARIMLRG